MRNHSGYRTVLNPDLFGQLRKIFGTVKIARQGTKIAYVSEVDPVTNRAKTTRKGGEYYCVNCPFCGDTKKRLWVSYLYGVNGAHYDLAFCNHQGCLGEFTNYHDFYSRVTFGLGFVRLDANAISHAKESPRTPEPIDGEVVSVGKLRSFHPARKYLIRRGFSPEALADKFNVGWCRYCENPKIVENRIIIPIVFDGQFAGYQARTMYDQQPKYFTSPGTKRGSLLFNYDRAKKYKTLIICEGPFDAIRCGPNAVAVLGDKITPQQLRLITSANPECVVILLDAFEKDSAKAERIRSGKRHRIEVLRNLLLSIVGFSASIVDIWLPGERDAGGYPTQEELHAAILKAAGPRRRKFKLVRYRESVDAT